MNAPDTHLQANTRLLRMPQVLDRVGLKKTVIYERIKAGTFPKPIKLGSASAWPEHEVENWIAQQVEEQRRRRTPQRERLHGELRSGDGVRGLTPNTSFSGARRASAGMTGCASNGTTEEK